MTNADATPTFSCTTVRDEDVVTIVAQGEIDLASSPQLREALHGALDAGAREIVVDLADVTFVDSSGLGVLVGALKRLHDAHPDGTVELRSMASSVRRVFEITGLTEVFVISG